MPGTTGRASIASGDAWRRVDEGWAGADTAKGPQQTKGFTYYQAGRRDSFRVLESPQACSRVGLASVEQLKLTGIVWDSRQYHALIEFPSGQGYAVRVNDVVCEGARVTKIGPTGVTLELEPGAGARDKSQKRQVNIHLGRD